MIDLLILALTLIGVASCLLLMALGAVVVIRVIDYYR
jgi:hypothetical protein